MGLQIQLRLQRQESDAVLSVLLPVKAVSKLLCSRFHLLIVWIKMRTELENRKCKQLSLAPPKIKMQASNDDS